MNSLGPWPWDGLNAFFATVRTGSLSAAAEVLGISQPTVGRRIDALEAAVGGVLVLRQPTGCRPTALGEAILPHLEQIRIQGQRIAAAVEQQRSDLRGAVRIATGPLLGNHLARHADALLAGLPGVELEVSPSMAYEDLVRGRADIAIRNQRPTDPEAIVRRLGDSPFGVYASASWVASREVDLTKTPDGSVRWVGHLAGSTAPSARWLRDRIGRDADVRFGTSIAVLEAVAAGVGPGVFPAYVGDSHPALRRVGPLLWDSLCFESWLVRPASTAGIPRIRAVAERLVAVLPVLERPDAP